LIAFLKGHSHIHCPGDFKEIRFLQQCAKAQQSKNTKNQGKYVTMNRCQTQDIRDFGIIIGILFIFIFKDFIFK